MLAVRQRARLDVASVPLRRPRVVRHDSLAGYTPPEPAPEPLTQRRESDNAVADRIGRLSGVRARAERRGAHVVHGTLPRRRGEQRGRLAIEATDPRACLASDDLFTGVGCGPRCRGVGLALRVGGDIARTVGADGQRRRPSRPAPGSGAGPEHRCRRRSGSPDSTGPTPPPWTAGSACPSVEDPVRRGTDDLGELDETDAAAAVVVDVAVDAGDPVVVVTAGRTLEVVVLELLVAPHATRTRERPPSPIKVKMLLRTGDPFAFVRSVDCAPDRHRGTGRSVPAGIGDWSSRGHRSVTADRWRSDPMPPRAGSTSCRPIAEFVATRGIDAPARRRR